MNFELKMHNIRIAWRNLMKYKVQNIISVLCLAVGMVIFSSTFIFTQRAWQGYERYAGDSRRAMIELYTKQNSFVCVEPSLIQRIANSHLRSIDFIDINLDACNTTSVFIDHDGKKYNVTADWRWISPKSLNHLGLRSAITGKRIPILKPGDIIMTKGMLARSFGLKRNPIGFTLDWSQEYSHPDVDSTHNTIIDVVDTGDWMLNEDHLFIVTDLLKELKATNIETKTLTGMHILSIILAKGKTETDLQKDLQKVLPEYEVRVKGKRSGMVQGVTFTLFFGSSILLIGLFGFLKMQIQLFRLRQREMGLRQCMGAQWEQLFGLMMWEVAIIFFFVTLLTLGLGNLLAEFAVPLLEREHDFLIDMPRTYTTILWICLATFLATSVIAVLSVRQVVTTPLSEVVGKSRRSSSRGHNLLIILQMVVCQILVLLFMVTASIIGKTSSEGSKAHGYENVSENIEKSRDCIVTDYYKWNCELLDTLKKLQHMAGVTHMASTFYSQYLKEGEEPKDSFNIYENRDGQRYRRCEVVLTDEHFFDVLSLKLVPSATEEQCNREEMVPVYQGIPNGKQTKKLGYVKIKHLFYLKWRDSWPRAIYVLDTAFFLQHKDLMLRVWDEFGDEFKNWGVSHSIIFRAKPGEYKKAVGELTDLYPRLGRYTMAKAPINNLNEKFYPWQYVSELIFYVLFVMYIVALLCVVLTLYSSVSLDVRGRQKEVAIRKTNGAGMKQIMWLFGKQYVWQLIISSIITMVISIGYVFWTVESGRGVGELIEPYLYAVLFISLVTLLTVGLKIYRVSKLNPAKIIKKE